jgi:hypothetical protein
VKAEFKPQYWGKKKKNSGKFYFQILVQILVKGGKKKDGYKTEAKRNW